jgi:lipid-binding SYLF domain-containing protein
VSVRDTASGTWSAPAFLTINGGSLGAQIGAQAIDLILVVNNRRGSRRARSSSIDWAAHQSRWPRGAIR